MKVVFSSERLCGWGGGHICSEEVSPAPLDSLGFRVEGLGFRVEGLGFSVEGSGFSDAEPVYGFIREYKGL